MRVLSLVPIVLASVLAALAVPAAEPNAEPNAAVEKRAADFTGRGTWFNTDNGFGACGEQETDSELIVALPTAIYAGGAHCFQGVTISANGVTVGATVFDLCPGCDPNGLDMTPTLFERFAPLSQGVVEITWNFS